MINFHVIKLAKGRTAKTSANECRMYLSVSYTELVRFHSCFVLFFLSFSGDFLFIHIWLSFYFSSTSLLIIWLVGFDQSQCQSNDARVCVSLCNFFNEGLFLYMYKEWMCQNMSGFAKMFAPASKRIFYFCFAFKYSAHPNKRMLQLPWISIRISKKREQKMQKNYIRLNDENDAGGAFLCASWQSNFALMFSFPQLEHFHIKHILFICESYWTTSYPFHKVTERSVFKLELQ